MRRVSIFLLLIIGFYETYEQDSSIKTKIKEVFGNGPSQESTATTSTTTAAPPPNPDEDEECGCPDSLSAVGIDKCICVSYYYCDNEKIIDKSGRGIINIRVDEDEPTPCPSLAWCCSLSNITNKAIKPVEQKTQGCGWRKPDGVGFRLTGNTDEALFGEFPWMVAVLYTDEFDDYGGGLPLYQCGGTLIHPRAVITAAHCVSNSEKNYIIRAGEWDSQTTREIYPTQDRKVKKDSIVIHPDYYGGAFFNDIAFLLLETPLDMSTPNIGVACLPPQGTQFSKGTRCFATGWGKDKYGQEGKYQVILKKIRLPIIDRKTCENSLKTTRLGLSFQLDTSFICAGGELGKDTCKGDGGSPLVCPIPGSKNQFQFAGIVSWGIGCGEDGIPGLYTDVALFRDWIDQQAKKYNLDSSTYTY